jgi:hypothetical protein
LVKEKGSEEIFVDAKIGNFLYHFSSALQNFGIFVRELKTRFCNFSKIQHEFEPKN